MTIATVNALMNPSKHPKHWILNLNMNHIKHANKLYIQLLYKLIDSCFTAAYLRKSFGHQTPPIYKLNVATLNKTQ